MCLNVVLTDVDICGMTRGKIYNATNFSKYYWQRSAD